ncbi:MAG: hypothetical protein ACF8CQ_09665 [Rhodopirellula sp. JB044]|uniref:hypothetical protein n=1 Tax=Rhodopirellula sp. JB044 TaxID=3342844 RepID=UPI00370A46A1
MTLYKQWIENGFEVQHTPGVSRSLIRIETNGDYFLLTDSGGYDIPNDDGPFRIMQLSRTGMLIDGPTNFGNRLALAAWLRRRSSIAIPTDPRM